MSLNSTHIFGSKAHFPFEEYGEQVFILDFDGVYDRFQYAAEWNNCHITPNSSIVVVPLRFILIIPGRCSLILEEGITNN